MNLEDVKNLEKDLDNAVDHLKTIEIKIEQVDTKDWAEFGNFFDAPTNPFSPLEFNDSVGTRHLIPCAFLSVVHSDKQKAIDALRKDLLKLWEHPDVVVPGFLAKPSVIEIRSILLKPGEVPDTTTCTDLRGPIPAKRRWAAFCFLFGYFERVYPHEVVALNKKNLTELGLVSACLEGEVGKDIEGTPVVSIDPIDPSETFNIDVEEVLYPVAGPPMEEVVLHKADGVEAISSVPTNTTAPEIVGMMQSEFAEAAKKHNIDLSATPGRELQEMRKYFSQGSGVYLVTVDFQTARTEAFKLDDRAQKKITRALKPAKKKRKMAPKKPAAKSKRKAKK